MLGAATELAADGFTVDATESRAFINGLDTVLTLAQQGRLGDVVVVHLGTNGTIQAADMTRMMDALAGVPQVLLLTIDVDRAWTAANNALVYDTVNTYPNVALLDWAGLAGNCPGDCFWSDGFHLRPDGQEYYAALIAGALQAPS
jgi:lysophospholipase L1-like esterase